MWIVNGPTWYTPVDGDGMDARTAATRAFCPSGGRAG